MSARVPRAAIERVRGKVLIACFATLVCLASQSLAGGAPTSHGGDPVLLGVPFPDAARARLHEVRLLYQIDRSGVPDWVVHLETTLNVRVGPALDVVALGDHLPVECRYDGERALVTTDADLVEVIVTAPGWPVDAMGDAHLATLWDDKLWALSLTLDDGYVSQATTARTLLDRYGYAGTIAVVGSWIGKTVNEKDMATAEQLREVVSAGWELSNHSSRHRRVEEIGGSLDVMRDIRAANEAIEAAVPGYVPRTFTSPFVDPEFEPIIVAYRGELGLQLIQTLTWEGRQVDPHVLRIDDVEPYSIGRRQLSNDGSEFDAIHARAASNPGTHWWFSLHTHEVGPACDCVETAIDHLYYTYGAAGSDEVWVAPAPQVFQYLIVRDRTIITEASRETRGAAPPGWTLPQPTAATGISTVVLQRLDDGSAQIQDTTISLALGAENKGGDWSLRVRSMAQVSSLIRVDVSSVPENAVVHRAVLELFGTGESNGATMCLDAYPLLRDWEEAYASWHSATADERWGDDGAAEAGVDRDQERVGLRGVVQGIDHWYRIDITQAVQDWVADPESNYGLVITGSGRASKQVTMASSEHMPADKRPSLMITYSVPPPDPPVPPMEGAGLLMAILQFEGNDTPPSASHSRPVTVSLSQTQSRDGGRSEVLAYQESHVTGDRGDLILEGLAPGLYDLRVTSPHALSVVRKQLRIRPGLNTVRLRAPAEGDVVQDGYIDARDWLAMISAIDDDTGVPGADLNEDGQVDVRDVALLSANYGLYGDDIQTQDPDQSSDPYDRTARLRIMSRPGTDDSHTRVFLGQKMDLEVTIDPGGHSVNGIDLWLEFDPEYLRLGEISGLGVTEAWAGRSGWGPMPGHDLDGADGRLRYVVASPTDLITRDLSVAALSFLAIKATDSPATGVETSVDIVRQGRRTSRVAAGGHDVLGSVAGASVTIYSRKRLFMPIVDSAAQQGLSQKALTHEPSAPVLDASGSGRRRPLQALGSRPAGPLGQSVLGAPALTIVGNVPLGHGPVEARDVRIPRDKEGTETFSAQSKAYVVMTTKWRDKEPFLHVLEISEPSVPDQIGELFTLSGDADEIWLDEGRAYVANKTYGVNIVDISSPETPLPLGIFSWNSSGSPLVKGVHTVGDRLYVADERGLRIVDVSDPSLPKLMSAVDRPFGEGVWSNGQIAYLAMDRAIYPADDGPEARPLFRLYDVSDPEHPSMLAEAIAPVAGRAVDVQVEDDVLFGAAEDGGIVAFDVSDPTKPEYLGAYASYCDAGSAFAHKIDVLGGIVYIADQEEGLIIVDARDPAAMRELGHVRTPGRSYGVTVAGGYAYVADGSEGVQIVDLAALTPTATPTLTPTPTRTPNPTVDPRTSLTLPMVMN